MFQLSVDAYLKLGFSVIISIIPVVRLSVTPVSQFAHAVTCRDRSAMSATAGLLVVIVVVSTMGQCDNWTLLVYIAEQVYPLRRDD